MPLKEKVVKENRIIGQINLKTHRYNTNRYQLSSQGLEMQQLCWIVSISIYSLTLCSKILTYLNSMTTFWLPVGYRQLETPAKIEGQEDSEFGIFTA